MPEKFTLKVNGVEVEMETEQERVVAHDILELAQKRGAVPGNIKDYDLDGDKGRYGWDAWVNLSEDSVFITLVNKPTPVAWKT